MRTSAAGLGAAALGTNLSTAASKKSTDRPNLVFVIADQWRAQATGYAGDRNVSTPNIDKLAGDCTNFRHAVSNCPVCSPFRASLMTGQYPLTHGVFLNDLRLNNKAVSFAQAYKKQGYHTAYIGKWHLDGGSRDAYIPPERRQGFDYFKALECTHNYNRSFYYAGESPKRKTWLGYDAYAQTDDAVSYINRRNRDGEPFCLFLSWGPPHNPYRTGPEDLVAKYDKMKLKIRGNVPAGRHTDVARKELAGYYAHCTALDKCVGRLLATLENTGLDRNTIFVFVSDHGDMLHSHGMVRKQKPQDESILIPFLLRCPTSWGVKPRIINEPVGATDIMPTILELSGIDVPDTVEGESYSPLLRGRREEKDRPILIMSPLPFAQWCRANGGREYRGVRTSRYTYVRDLDGPWLLFDNEKDPLQQTNMCGKAKYLDLQKQLESELEKLLEKTGDDFVSGPALVNRCGYNLGRADCIPNRDPAQVSVKCRK